MFKFKAALIGMACLALAAPAAAQSVQTELALAHAYLDDQLEQGLRAEVGSVSTFLTGEEGFTAAELAALDRAYSRELEVTITEAQDLIAKAASDAFTEAELRAPDTISEARWQTVLAPLGDRLTRIGASLAAKAILAACASVSAPSDACKAYSTVARDFLSGEISVQDIKEAAAD